ncbi:unnamed protein product [Adineta steineri]|uniref:Uncharacterized protein n=1 Tax=Adineta steineri TaxID=433720 RepID=A0A820DF19_9BILA|nr:unnamed protein product [Adineta steineri]CAF4231179.1 unnamed protein product [Adineta steineri]
MSNHSSAQNTSFFQPDRAPFAQGQHNQFAQFTAAASHGYQPRPQMSATTTTSAVVPRPTDTPSQTNKLFPPPDITVAAYLSQLDKQQYIKPLPPQPFNLEKVKDFKFVTADSLVLETREIYDKVSDTFQWEMCLSESDRCIKFIQEKCAKKRVFLVTSGGLGHIIIPAVHDLPQVYAIYIYCGTMEFHLPLQSKYSKVRVVCSHDDQYLIPQLAVDVAQANIDWGDALVAKGDRATAKEKFEKALTNLEKYAKKPDPTMINEVKTKLEQCK